MSYNPGIVSLAGYTYQIRVFTLLLAIISENVSIGIEVIDDISLSKSNFCDIDDKKSESISTIIDKSTSYKVIQVKKTKLTQTCINKIWYNWLIEYNRYKNIDEFVLYYDSTINNGVDLCSKSATDYFELIKNTKSKSEKSLVVQVKKLYKDFDEFEKAYNHITTNIKTMPINNIDEEIYNQYKSLFHWSSNHDELYKLRLDDLCSTIQNEVLNNTLRNQPFLCGFEKRNQIIDDIIRRITSDEYEMDYSVFRNINSFDLNSDSIFNAREYRQLNECGLSSATIKNLLMNQMYYEDYSYKMFTLLCSNKINNIETTANENFYEVKDELVANDKDTPNNRLMGTIAKSNSYAMNEQIQKGVCIHLTSNNVDDELQISWSDI